MGQLGMGVAINRLFEDGCSARVFQRASGKLISNLTLEENVLHIGFTDGCRIAILDTEDQCCEERFMQTDDVLGDYIGGELLDAEIREAPNEDDGEYGEHEVQFLVVKTSKGQLTMASHNKHNGYYGGFSIVIREEVWDGSAVEN